MNTNERRWRAAMIVLLLVVGAGMATTIGRPYTDAGGFALGEISLQARNHLDAGYAATRLTSVDIADVSKPQDVAISARHPFLFPLIVSVAHHVFGPTDWAAQVVALAVTLISAWLMYLLVARLSCPAAGWFAAAFFVICPISLFFGTSAYREAPAELFIILATLFYVRWLESGTWRWYAAVVIAMTLGMLCDWQAFYMSGILPLHYILFARQGRQLVRALLLGFVGPVMFALFVLHVGALEADPIAHVKSIFFQRSAYGGGDITAEQVSFIKRWYEFFITTEAYVYRYVLAPMVIIAGGGALWLVARIVKPDADQTRANLALPFFLIGPYICHAIVFTNTVRVHVYLLVMALPFLAALAGIAAGRLWSSKEWRSAATCVVAFAFALFVIDSIRNTRGLLGEVDDTPLRIGRDIAKTCSPTDHVLIVGIRQTPVLNWYSKRNVETLSLDNEVETVLKAGLINRVAIINVKSPSYEQVKDRSDAWATGFVARTKAWRDFLADDPHVVTVTDTLTLYDLSSHRASDTPDPPKDATAP